MLQRTTLRRLIVPVVLCAAACVAVRAPGQETDTAATVEAAVEDMDEAATVSEVFDIARELDRLGASGLTAVKEALPEAGPRARLGLARYLLGQRERKMALASLEETIRGEDVEAAASAAEMIERYAEDKKEVLRLKSILEQVREPSVKIAVAKALRARANDTKAEAVLKDYLKSGEFEVRANAALALAEIGNVAAAKSVLNELADEPTDRGKRAKSLLYQDKLVESLRRSGGLSGDKHTKRLEAKVDALKEELEKTQKKAEAAAAAAAKGGGGKAKAPAAKGYKLLEELTKNIKEYYVEEDERTEDKQLFDEAAKGMVGSLDPFSSYMTEKETQDFRQSMSGSYAGIGAVVSIDPKDKLLTIIRPIYSGPAYKAGLRSLDKITKVEGESTFGKKVEQLVTKLKGKPDTPVKISVFRKGWKKEREFTLMRGTITLKSVHHKMLPGKIGYISLSQFGDKAVDEIEDAMTELEQQGMRAMIFDLRNNPGGLLTAAVDISDKFLKDNKLIVYSQGRNKRIAPRRDYRTRQTSTHPDIPLVVLINGASASASEIVSGALQDHKRATLVGTNTFGKGSVQQLLRVRTTGGESTLRLTIAKYYLPSGRSIHRDPKTGEGGVDPGIVVEQEEPSTWEVEEADEVMSTGKVDEYVNKLWKEHKQLLRELAEHDGDDETRYPGFEAWHNGLDTPLDESSTRALVRAQVRRLAQDENGEEFAFDLQIDNQLQRGVYELLKKLEDDPSAYDWYRPYTDKFAEAPNQPKEEGEIR